MNIYEKAKLAACFCFSSHSSKTECAVGWVIEDLVLPDPTEAYTAEEMEQYILEALKKREEMS